MTKQRLQKILSQTGLGSRREMERWITEGLVTVNGKPAKLGDVASESDAISVRGRPIAHKPKPDQKVRILLYHKPIGEVCSRNDPTYKKTVFEKLPRLKQGRWVQVGRLDINTSGLLIFTTDGDLANRLMHPRYELEREYAVRVHGTVKPEMIQALLKGVPLEDGMARFKKVEFRGGEGVNQWYHVILTEGRNREVRRLWQSQGLDVSRLIRVRYGQMVLPRNLSRGQAVELQEKEVENFLTTLC